MAKLQHFTPRVTAEAVITLDEIELRALQALVCYGIDPLLALFYKHMGTAYLKPHEAGLRSFMKTAAQTGQAIRAIDDSQRCLDAYRIERGRRKAAAETQELPK